MQALLIKDRLISVHFQGKPFTVIQDYAPATNAEEAEIDQFYEDLIRPRTGNWNAKVGTEDIPAVTGKFGLEVQSEARQRLTKFCQEETLVIANTLFQQHKRRLHMDITRWSIPKSDFCILCSQRWRSSIQSTKTRPGADGGSDHNLLLQNSDLK